MAYVVRMPKLGVEMEIGKVIAWHVDVADAVSESDVVAEIESEKSVAEIEAREDGVLRRVYLDVDEEAPPGAPMGIVAGAEADLSELEATVESAVSDVSAGDDPGSDHAADAAADALTDDSAEAAGVTDVDEFGEPAAQSAGAGTTDGAANGSTDSEPVAATTPEGTLKATPKAKDRAAKLGVDLATIEGTGVRDSVTASDVERAASADSGKRTVEETREVSGRRRTIAERLGRSYREAVHVTVDREVEVETVFAAAAAVDVSITDVILEGVSETLSVHPAFNATFDADAETHTLYEEHNVGVAIDLDGGVVTPVLSDIGSMDLAGIASAREAMTTRVLNGEFTAEDLSGGTFTVSNLGVFGSDAFTPIINPPEVAILGVNRVTECPVRTDRGIEFRRHVTFSFTFDHRVLDGADAARFLTTLEDRLADTLEE